MIRRLHLKNFRSVKSASVNIAPLTVIVGENSSGKSVLSRAIAMLAGNFASSTAGSTSIGSDHGFNLFQPDGSTMTFRQLVNESQLKGKKWASPRPPEGGGDAPSMVFEAEFLGLADERDNVKVRFELTPDQRGTGASIHRQSATFKRAKAGFFEHWQGRLSGNGWGEFAKQAQPDWTNQRIERRFERLEDDELERPKKKSNQTGEEPSHKWVETIIRDPEGELAAHLSKRPALLELLRQDNSDVEWINDLAHTRPLAVPRSGIDPMTALIEGVISAFAQLRTASAKKNLSPSLHNYAPYQYYGNPLRFDELTSELNLRKQQLDNMIDELEALSSEPKSDEEELRLNRLSLEVDIDRLVDLVGHLEAEHQKLEVITTLETGSDCLPAYAVDPEWGLPIGLDEQSIKQVLMPGMPSEIPVGLLNYGSISRGGLSGGAMSMQFAAASQKISRVVQLILRNPEFSQLLRESKWVTRVGQRNPGSLVGPPLGYSAVPNFSDKEFYDLVADSFRMVPGIGTDREAPEAQLTIEMVSLLAYVSPVKLRGLVWKELEGPFASETLVPSALVELARLTFRPLIKVSDEPITVMRYISEVGRQGSLRIPFLHGNETSLKNHQELSWDPVSHDHGEVSGHGGSSDVRGRLESWGSNFLHIGAIRATSPSFTSSWGAKLQSDGSNAVEVLSKMGDRVAPPRAPRVPSSVPRLFVNHPQSEPTISQQVANWMKYLGLINSYRIRDVPYGGLRLFVTTTGSSMRRDLSEVGSGVGQVVPILLAPLLADPGTTVVIEEPEAHLHPGAQVALGDFIVACVASGRQLIVETHSEHIVNRVRLRIAEGHLASTDATMIGVTLNSDEGTIYTANQFLEDGTFSGDWPSGFFGVGLRDAVELSQYRNFER